MEWIWMGGRLLSIELNLTRGLVETGMGTGIRTVIGDVIVIGVGIETVVVGVDLVGTVSNVESLGILLGNALPGKGLEVVDMVEGMTGMVVAVAMALIVMVIGMVAEAETLVVVVDQGMISTIVTDLDLTSAQHLVAFDHDGCSNDGSVWKASRSLPLKYFSLHEAFVINNGFMQSDSSQLSLSNYVVDLYILECSRSCWIKDWLLLVGKISSLSMLKSDIG